MFSRERHGDFRVYRLNTAEGVVLRDALLFDPERLVAGGEVFKPGSRGFAVGVVIGGRRYFLKAYDCLGWGYRLRNAFRRSRALHTWAVTWGLFRRGIPVPKPLVCLEERHWRLLGRSYLVTEIVSGATDLDQSWVGCSRQDKVKYLAHVGQLMGKMHRTGCSHGDMKWNNILVRAGESGSEVVFVDTDSARISTRPSKRRIRKDLDRFLRDLQKNESDPFFSEWFRENWNRAFNEV